VSVKIILGWDCGRDLMPCKRHCSLLLLSLEPFDSSRPQQLVSSYHINLRLSHSFAYLVPKRTYSRCHAIIARPDSYNGSQVLSRRDLADDVGTASRLGLWTLAL